MGVKNDWDWHAGALIYGGPSVKLLISESSHTSCTLTHRGSIEYSWYTVPGMCLTMKDVTSSQ